MDQSLFQYLLRLGDTTLILSQRLCEWCGHGPELEEDLAMTNLSLDLLGQARLWLTLAGEVEGRARDEDALAYLRDAPEYRNYLLAERSNGHYGDTIARQFFFDVWHYFLLKELSGSADERVAAIAEKSLKEVTYHVRRSSDRMVRLAMARQTATPECRPPSNRSGPIWESWLPTTTLRSSWRVSRSRSSMPRCGRPGSSM